MYVNVDVVYVTVIVDETAFSRFDERRHTDTLHPFAENAVLAPIVDS